MRTGYSGKAAVSGSVAPTVARLGGMRPAPDPGLGDGPAVLSARPTAPQVNAPAGRERRATYLLFGRPGLAPRFPFFDNGQTDNGVWRRRSAATAKLGVIPAKGASATAEPGPIEQRGRVAGS